ncbi:MAG: ROK family protein [Bacteroidota bacterium]|nr:ROK family protein [Chlorobiota bacterium]MDW8074387.1 ROK family protein [Bacteroidota bacterium]
MLSGEWWSVGFDVGGTTVKAAVVRCKSREVTVVTTAAYPTIAIATVEDFINLLAEQYAAFVKAYPEIGGLGIGFPACVHWKEGIVTTPPNIGWWDKEEYPLRTVLEKQLQVPVALDNDANAAALAEMIMGAGRQLNSFLFVTLGTGVGGAIVLNRQIIRGERGCAGEIGHMIIDAHEESVQPSWRRGVLERFIGREAICQRAYAAIERYPHSILSQYGNNLDVIHVSSAAEAGDNAALDVLRETARFFGIGLASALAILGIEHVVVAGGISQLPPLFYDVVHQTILERALPAISTHVVIHRSTIGSYAGVIGAALLTQGEEANFS